MKRYRLAELVLLSTMLLPAWGQPPRGGRDAARSPTRGVVKSQLCSGRVFTEGSRRATPADAREAPGEENAACRC